MSNKSLKRRLIKAFLDMFELTPADQESMSIVSTDKDTYFVQSEQTGRVYHLEKYDDDLSIGYSEKDGIMMYHHNK